MKLTSKDLLELKIIDEIIYEPDGGAHRDRDLILSNVKKSISKNLNELMTLTRQDIINHRKNKFLNVGRDKVISNNNLSSNDLFSNRVNKIFDVRQNFGGKKMYFFLSIVLIVILILTLQLNFG